MLKSKQTIHKKAQISPVFKYIFVLVIGAIILVFFLKFALKTEKVGHQVIKAEVLHALDSSLQAFSVSGYSSGAMPTPPWPQIVHMKFGTKANCGKFTVEGQKYPITIERIIFGPEEMKTKQLQAWTLSWNFPFRITNFFFLVNPQRSKYYLIYDKNDETEFEFVKSISTASKTSAIEHLPESFKVKYKESESEPKSVLKSADMVKVNYFTELEGSCPGRVSPGLKGSCIKYSNACKEELSSGELYKCFGEVIFYDGNKETGSSAFIGREMMFGAIMADSYEVYDCQYERALDELKRFVNLYKTKAGKIKSKKTLCIEGSGNKYDEFFNKLDNFNTDINTLKGAPSYDHAKKVSEDAESIKAFNKDELSGDSDCEMVF